MEQQRIKINEENIRLLIGSGKIYLHKIMGNIRPLGNADYAILSYIPGYDAWKATSEDIDFILSQPAKTINITPICIAARDSQTVFEQIKESGYSGMSMVHRLPGEQFIFEVNLQEVPVYV